MLQIPIAHLSRAKSLHTTTIIYFAYESAIWVKLSADSFSLLRLVLAKAVQDGALAWWELGLAAGSCPYGLLHRVTWGFKVYYDWVLRESIPREPGKAYSHL